MCKLHHHCAFMRDPQMRLRGSESFCSRFYHHITRSTIKQTLDLLSSNVGQGCQFSSRFWLCFFYLWKRFSCILQKRAQLLAVVVLLPRFKLIIQSKAILSLFMLYDMFYKMIFLIIKLESVDFVNCFAEFVKYKKNI